MVVQRAHSLLIRGDLGFQRQERADVSENGITNWKEGTHLCISCKRIY